MSRAVVQSSEGLVDDRLGFRREGRDLLRAIAAGSIVGIPLLYTMEMWWRGMTMSPWHQLGVLGAALVINFCFCLFSGFREEYSVVEAISESVTAVGMGLVYALGILVLIGEVTFERSWGDVVGRVVAGAGPVSLGIAFANRQVRKKLEQGDEEEDEGDENNSTVNDVEKKQLDQDLKEFAVTVSGAMIFSYNMAPTEEILKISARLTPWQHLAIVGAAMFLGYLILFAAQFKEREVHVKNWFQRPGVETVMAYAVALLVAFVLLQLVGVAEVKGNMVVATQAAV